MSARRTVYLIVRDRKRDRRLGVTALKRLAGEIADGLPRRTLDTYRGDYVAGGTRFDLLDPEHVHDGTCVQTPVLKVRGDDLTRDRVYRAIPRRYVVEAIAAHDRTRLNRP